mgnify:CR=1 FL=1
MSNPEGLQSYKELLAACEYQRRDLDEKNTQLQAVIESSPVGIMLIGPAGKVTELNRRLEAFLGADAASLTGRPARDILREWADRTRPATGIPCLASLLGEGESRCQLEWQEPAPRTVLLQYSPVSLPDGRPHGGLLLVEDVSEVALLRREVTALAEFPRTNPMPVLRFGRDGSLKFLNPAAETFFLHLKAGAEDLREALLDGERSLIELVLTSGKPWWDVTIEFRSRTLSATLAPFPGRGEVFLTLVDLTEKLKAERRLREQAEELRKAYDGLRESQAKLIHSERKALIGSLAAGIAHELNTPSGVIQSGCDTIARVIEELRTRFAPNIEPGAKGRWEAILKLEETLTASMKIAAGRIADITATVKDFAGLDNAPVRMTCLEERLENALLLVRNRITPGIAVVRDYQDRTETQVRPAEIGQAFITVILNALERLNGSGELRLRTERDGSAIAAVIEDSGPEIPAEEMKTLFEPRIRVHDKRVGASFGLWVAQRIAQDHGGQIQAENLPQGGCRFTFYLPQGGGGLLAGSDG